MSDFSNAGIMVNGLDSVIAANTSLSHVFGEEGDTESTQSAGKVNECGNFSLVRCA